MKMSENHLDVFCNRSELHVQNNCLVFEEGPQSAAARKRYSDIRTALNAGFLANLLSEVKSGKIDFSDLNESICSDLRKMVDSITGDAGRALTIVLFTQLAVKSISPGQSIRLHKGNGTKKKEFSWKEGVSLRSLDAKFISPFLRDNQFLSINKDGGMMTRTLAENYPYSALYKAKIEGPVTEWVRILDDLENGCCPARKALAYLMALLLNRSVYYGKLVDEANSLLGNLIGITLSEANGILSDFLSRTLLGARAFEVVLHSFMQAIEEVGGLEEGRKLRPLTQMRSANAKAKNIGDVEIEEDGVIIEAWDAKFGKYYFYDELVELGSKLHNNPDATIVGFVSDGEPIQKADILTKKKEIGKATNTAVEIFSFTQWVQYQAGNLSEEQRSLIGLVWIRAAVESFSRKRPGVAPIDEPCDGWLKDIADCIKDYLLKKKGA